MLARFVSYVVEGWFLPPPLVLWLAARKVGIPFLIGWWGGELVGRWLA